MSESYAHQQRELRQKLWKQRLQQFEVGQATTVLVGLREAGEAAEKARMLAFQAGESILSNVGASSRTGERLKRIEAMLVTVILTIEATEEEVAGIVQSMQEGS